MVVRIVKGASEFKCHPLDVEGNVDLYMYSLRTPHIKYKLDSGQLVAIVDQLIIPLFLGF